MINIENNQTLHSGNTKNISMSEMLIEIGKDM